MEPNRLFPRRMRTILHFRIGIDGAQATRLGLRPVGRSAGDLFPHFIIHFVKVVLDRELFAARRAAKYHLASANTKLDLLAAILASDTFHRLLLKGFVFGVRSS